MTTRSRTVSRKDFMSVSRDPFAPNTRKARLGPPVRSPWGGVPALTLIVKGMAVSRTPAYLSCHESKVIGAKSGSSGNLFTLKFLPAFDALTDDQDSGWAGERG